MSKSYRLQFHEPGKKVRRLLLTVILLLLTGWSLYYIGGAIVEKSLGPPAQETKALRKQVRELEASNRKLLHRVTTAERAGEIERRSAERLREAIEQLEAKIEDLAEELMLYRVIVSPEKAQAGLHVQSLEFAPAGSGGVLAWRLIMAQARGTGSQVQGNVELIVEGRQGNVARKIDLAELLPEGQGAVKFSFRYFQSLEGRVSLPEGFDPVDVLIRLRPEGDGSPVEARFPWSSVLAKE